MKKLFLMLFLTMIFTTGCVKTDTTITFDNKGNAVVENDFLINQELGTYEKIDTTFEDLKPVDNENTRTEKVKITEDKMVGAKYITTVPDLLNNDLKDIVRILKPAGERLLTAEKHFFYDKYRLAGYVEGFKKEVDPNTATNVNINDIYKSKITVKLPCKPKSHNAKIVNGDRELCWPIDYTQNNDIYVEFILLNYLAIGGTIAGGILFLSLILLLVMKRRKIILNN